MRYQNVLISFVEIGTIFTILYSQGPIYYDWLTLIPAWINNHSKVWDEITYPFPNFNGYLRIDKEFHSTLYNGCNYLSMLGLNSN